MIKTISPPQRDINEFESDSRWFYENMDTFRAQHLMGTFVAIKNKHVLAHNKNINLVVKSVEEQGENPAYIFIEFVHPKGTVILF